MSTVEKETSTSANTSKVIGASGDEVWNLALKLLEKVPSGKLLEVAAGGGYLASHLA